MWLISSNKKAGNAIIYRKYMAPHEFRRSYVWAFDTPGDLDLLSSIHSRYNEIYLAYA